ncbi:TOBE domain-containing protein [Mesorhizobium sp. M1322]
MESSAAPPGDPEQNFLRGVVFDVAPLGPDVHVVVELPEKSRLLVIQKNVGTMSGLIVGHPVYVKFAAANVLTF